MAKLLRPSMAMALSALFLAGSITAVAQGHRKAAVVVSPGESIQAAIDAAADHGWVFVLPGIYQETADATNGLTITRGINLVGLSTPTRRVVLRNAGGQRNGIVVVPQDRTACLSCHSSLAPPFDLLPGVTGSLQMRQPMIRDFSIRGFTIQGFTNNGLFTENVDGFSIDDVESIDNANYGIFPTLSKNGVVSHSRATGAGDTGVWVETSENVVVTDTLVEGNVVGFEVSNSVDVSFARNESRNNSIGLGLFVLPGLSEDRPDTKRIVVHDNSFHDNNRPNTARPGTLLSALPSGVGLLHMAADDSLLVRNRFANHALAGLAIVDACVAWAGTRFDCSTNPFMTPQFLADQDATNNRVLNNLFSNNGVTPPPSPFAFAAGDIALLSSGAGNCFSNNSFVTSFSLLGVLPPCS